MAVKKIKNVSDIKTLDQLRELKVRKKHEVELKKLVFQANIIRVQMNLDPDRIQDTLVMEAKGYIQNIAIQYLPSFILNFLKR